MTKLLPEHERMFDTGRMLSREELEIIRRSAAMAPLAPGEIRDLIDVCDELLRQRAQVIELLERLPESFSAVRGTLNELHRAMRQ